MTGGCSQTQQLCTHIQHEAVRSNPRTSRPFSLLKQRCCFTIPISRTSALESLAEHSWGRSERVSGRGGGSGLPKLLREEKPAQWVGVRLLRPVRDEPSTPGTVRMRRNTRGFPWHIYLNPSTLSVGAQCWMSAHVQAQQALAVPCVQVKPSSVPT